VETWHSYQCLVLQGEAENSPMDPEMQKELDNLEANLAAAAQQGGYETVQEMLNKDIAPGITYEDYYGYLSVYSTGYSHYMHRCDIMEITDDMIEAYFNENEEALAESEVTKDSGKYVDVRHILVQVEGGTADETGAVTYSEEEWAACEAEAQAILDAWLAGDKTEDSFAALANEKSEDPGSNTNGGLYEHVYMGQMVEPFETWCFDESRQYGDYDLVQTSYGYHVMFFVKSEPRWPYYAESDWLNEQSVKLLEEVVAKYPMEVTFENIALGVVKMG
jgi:hypothetical protein